jgi:hypothetical protein
VSYFSLSVSFAEVIVKRSHYYRCRLTAIDRDSRCTISFFMSLFDSLIRGGECRISPSTFKILVFCIERPIREGMLMQGALAIDYFSAAFADAISIYLLSLFIDVDYYGLRERDYPLLAPSQMAERLRKVAELFPANPGFEFAVFYKRRS